MNYIPKRGGENALFFNQILLFRHAVKEQGCHVQCVRTLELIHYHSGLLKVGPFVCCRFLSSTKAMASLTIPSFFLFAVRLAISHGQCFESCRLRLQLGNADHPKWIRRNSGLHSCTIWPAHSRPWPSLHLDEENGNAQERWVSSFFQSVHFHSVC